MSPWESRDDAASGLEDDRVSRELLGILQGDDARPPRTLVVDVLSRVRRALGLRDLFEGLAVAPFRTFAHALRRPRSDRKRNRSSTP